MKKTEKLESAQPSYSALKFTYGTSHPTVIRIQSQSTASNQEPHGNTVLLNNTYFMTVTIMAGIQDC